MARAERRREVKVSNGDCLDAASGKGPITYPCHSADQADPNQLFDAEPGEPFAWQAGVLAAREGQRFCVQEAAPDDTKRAVLATCAAEDPEDPARAGSEAAEEEALVPKRGQGFERRGLDPSDGSFALAVLPERELCLSARRRQAGEDGLDIITLTITITIITITAIITSTTSTASTIN